MIKRYVHKVKSYPFKRKGDNSLITERAYQKKTLDKIPRVYQFEYFVAGLPVHGYNKFFLAFGAFHVFDHGIHGFFTCHI